MSTVALERPRLAPSPATSVRQLAAIEAKRYAKHPLFIVGALMCAGLSIGLPGPDELDYAVIPAFFLGVLGFDRVGPADPVHRHRGSGARCRASVDHASHRRAVPGLRRPCGHGTADRPSAPRDDARRPDRRLPLRHLGGLDRQVLTLVLPVVYAAGGPCSAWPWAGGCGSRAHRC